MLERLATTTSTDERVCGCHSFREVSMATVVWQRPLVSGLASLVWWAEGDKLPAVVVSERVIQPNTVN